MQEMGYEACHQNILIKQNKKIAHRLIHDGSQEAQGQKKLLHM